MTNLQEAVRDEILENTVGMTFEEAETWVKFDAVCVSGGVSGLIYYSDTSIFFDTNEDEILDLAREYDYDISVTELGMTGFKNDMAWFSFEVLKDAVFENLINKNDYN